MKQKQTIVLTAAVTSLIVYLITYLFFPCKTTVANPIPQESLYSHLRSTGTIRAAYAVGAPLFIIDPNTKEKSGIFYELVGAAASKLNLKVEWVEEVGYGEMIQGLVDRRYDIVGSGVWLNGARGQGADFTVPVYYDALLAYTREGDTRFDDDLSILNSPEYTISTMDGELGATIAETDFPKASTHTLPQIADFTQLILNVVNRKSDIVFLALAPARQYQAANPGMIRAVPSRDPLRIFPVAILVPKGTYELRESINYALTEMLTNGEVEAILRKYEKVPGSFVRFAPPYRLSEFAP